MSKNREKKKKKRLKKKQQQAPSPAESRLKRLRRLQEAGFTKRNGYWTRPMTEEEIQRRKDAGHWAIVEGKEENDD
jgi:hypothetical protein